MRYIYRAGHFGKRHLGPEPYSPLQHGFEYYRAFLPAARNDSAEVYTMEPYVYAQFIKSPRGRRTGAKG